VEGKTVNKEWVVSEVQDSVKEALQSADDARALRGICESNAVRARGRCKCVQSNVTVRWFDKCRVLW
jgi:hypothetical protein